MTDTGNSRHVLRGNLDSTNHSAFEEHISRREIFLDGVLDVRKSFMLSGALRPAPWQTGNRHAVTLICLEQCDLVFHEPPPSVILLSGRLTRSCKTLNVSAWIRVGPGGSAAGRNQAGRLITRPASAPV